MTLYHYPTITLYQGDDRRHPILTEKEFFLACQVSDCCVVIQPTPQSERTYGAAMCFLYTRML